VLEPVRVLLLLVLLLLVLAWGPAAVWAELRQ
jgi:hypothetical protein